MVYYLLLIKRSYIIYYYRLTIKVIQFLQIFSQEKVKKGENIQETCSNGLSEGYVSICSHLSLKTVLLCVHVCLCGF